MKRGAAVGLTLCVGAGAAVPPSLAHAELGIDDSVSERAPWSDGSARTMPRGRAEVALFSSARWAPWDGVELGAHPVWFFALPHAEAKLTWASWNQAWYVGSAHRVSYPTPFLHLVSREGAGGLLPNDTDVPQAFVFDNAVLVSRVLGPWHVVTLRAGLSVAAQSSADLPLLDFPFLYQRFAPLYAPLVPRLLARAEGRLVGPVYFAVEAQASYLPFDEDYGAPRGWAYEEALTLHYRPSSKHQLSAGVRAEQAVYPIGTRTHLLPTLDYRYAW